jgi:GNAT superfamily N-acetyltransferase
MVRAGLAAVAMAIFFAAPAAAQPGEAAKVERSVLKAGRWAEKLGEALTVAQEGFSEINQRMRALVAGGVTREKASAEAPAIRRLIEASQADLRRSVAILAALPPFPAEMPMDFSPAQLVADARGQITRYQQFLDDYDGFIVAMAKADAAGMERALPKLEEGATAMVGSHRLMFRSRQASVPATDSGHQGLGVASQLYRATEAVARNWLAARKGEAAAPAAAAALREELRIVARDTRALVAAGRLNLKRELSEVEALGRGSAGDKAEARLNERLRAVIAAEEKTFEIGDRLAAFAEARAGITPAELRQSARPLLLTPLSQLEADYMATAQEQVALVAEEPK